MTAPDPDAAPRLRLLLLAGTAEARALADRLAETPSVDALASLAGATERPAPYAIPTRRGGFGGAGALRAFLAEGRFDAVIDAAHPFAARIGAAAVEACAALALPLLRLERSPWRPEPGDRWTEVPDAETAAAALPPGAVAFLATGPGSLPPFAARRDLTLALRLIDPPRASLPPHIRPVPGRPPFSTEAEITALRDAGATHLVCKNAGGAPGRAKLDAARALRLPVVMIARPLRPEGVESVATVEEAMGWVARFAPPRRSEPA